MPAKKRFDLKLTDVTQKFKSIRPASFWARKGRYVALSIIRIRCKIDWTNKKKAPQDAGEAACQSKQPARADLVSLESVD